MPHPISTFGLYFICILLPWKPKKSPKIAVFSKFTALMYHIVVPNQGRHTAIMSKGRVYCASLHMNINLKFRLNSVATETRKKTKKGHSYYIFLLTLSKFCS